MKFRDFFEQSNTLDVVQQYLAKIESSGFVLLAHQTMNDTALKIIKGMDFSGGGSGVEGTALYTNSAAIRGTVEQMMRSQNGQALQGNAMIHKGANSVVVMAIPRQVAGRSVRDLDDKLVDLWQAKRIKIIGIPNNYIIGFWQGTGQFFGNSRFKPDGRLS